MNNVMRLLGALLLLVASTSAYAGCWTDGNGIMRCAPDGSGACFVRADGALVCP